MWHRQTIIYGVALERFADGNGDGIGDLQGLEAKLPYLADLGIDCIWLLPIHPSGGHDNGYDPTDYYAIDPRFGGAADFGRLIGAARSRGIRVIMDLVAEHTSDQHSWFAQARASASSRYRDFYIWSEHPLPVGPHTEQAFPGEESRVWTYDDAAGAYYYHRFYRFQPSLNLHNPQVREEIKRVMTYWLELGVSGFRVDAATGMVCCPKRVANGPEDAHDVLRDLYGHAKSIAPDCILLGEIDVAPSEVGAFFDGTQVDVTLNFLLNAYLLLALAQQRGEPLARLFKLLPPCPGHCQYVNFLRNLDEANLGRLTREERGAVYEAFAPEPHARIYQRGVRRRLAAMLGDERRVRLAWSLLLSLPGVPLLVYGDEIGMGDDLSQPGRTAVRAPMQWSSAPNAGFSTAPRERLVQPVIETGRFGYRRINVQDEAARSDSLLNHVKRVIHLRRECGVIDGQNSCEWFDSGSEHVLAFGYRSRGESLVLLHNLSDQSIKVDLQPAGLPRLRETLEPYASRWLRLRYTDIPAHGNENSDQTTPHAAAR